MRTWALCIVLAAASACAAPPVDPFAIPYDRFSPRQKKKIDEVMQDITAVVPLEESRVESRGEIFDFLMAEMPFTGGIVRELGRGTWEIFRDPDHPRPDVFYVVDPQGLQLRFEMVHRDESRRFYVSQGEFDMGPLPALKGRTLVILRTRLQGKEILTDAVVYVRVESSVYAKLASGAPDLVHRKVRERSAYFIQAAKWVAEEAARRPDWLYHQVRGSDEVDPETLERFRRKFLKP